MSVWVKLLVVSFVGVFALLALILAVSGDGKAAMGSLVIAAMVSPALLEVWRPGKYVFRKPVDGSPDTLLNRMKLFRVDHPGKDGAFLIGVFIALGMAGVLGSISGLLKAFNA